MEIRLANRQDDFAALGAVYVKSWRTAYRGIVPQAYLDGLTEAGWAARLRGDMDRTCVLVDAGRYAGVASFGPARDSAMAGWGEIVSIYLLPEYFGQGYGKRLLACAEAGLRRAGHADIYLWVLRQNARAQGFYLRSGYRPDGGTARITIGGAVLEELRYSKHLP